MAVAETNWTFSAGVVPMRSVAPASKPLPVTVTGVPPNVVPVAGETAEMAIREGVVGLAPQDGPEASTRLHRAICRSVARGTALSSRWRLHRSSRDSLGCTARIL